MTVYLFVGPTLPRVQTEGLADFTCLPPAAMGDVYHAAASRPTAIGIVDGYFEGVPAVWHKEILWAMSQGIHVFGSASMGALRAAELHRFGMHGIGRIFEAYRSGDLEDDDEVAVVHGPAEAGYVCLSEPLVNIRATLEEAEKQAIIGASTRSELIGRAKDLFYQDRSWQRLIADGAVGDHLRGEIRRLRDWLPAGKVDRKRADALDMIAAMRAFLTSKPPPHEPAFKFEWTDMWDIATRSMARRATRPGDPGGAFEKEWMLDELRLDGATFDALRPRALLRYLIRRGGLPRAETISAAAVREAEQQLRIRLGLIRGSDVARWCADNSLDRAEFRQLTEEHAQLALVDATLDAGLGPELLDELRLEGGYGRYLERAREKRAYLAAHGQEDATPADCGQMAITLVAWHFERLQQPIPDDLQTHARRLGWPRLADFYRALVREWLYSQRGQAGADR
jgi:hypothetical protein